MRMNRNVIEPRRIKVKEVVGGQELTKSFELISRGVETTRGAAHGHCQPVVMGRLAEKGLTGQGMELYFGELQAGESLRTAALVGASPAC